VRAGARTVCLSIPRPINKIDWEHEFPMRPPFLPTEKNFLSAGQIFIVRVLKNDENYDSS